MKTEIFKADSRGGANHGWLDTKHSYSFSTYFDPKRIHFGALRVVNDDIVAPGMGFGKHPHDNMEIVSIPQKGALQHGDSMGNGSVIEAGDVQAMSAGTGIFHSEMNANKDQPVEFFQIWVIPNKMNLEPRYQQISIREVAKSNELYQIVSPNPDDDGLWIHQDAWFLQGEYTEEKKETYKLKKPEHGVFFFVVEGEVEFEGEALGRRDAVEISETPEFSFKTKPGAKVLLIEVPMLEF